MSIIGAYQFTICQYSWHAFEQKMHTIINEAVKKKINLLLLPEYFGVCVGDDENNDRDLFASLQRYLPDFISLFSYLAKENNLYILAGTIPVKSCAGYKNRAYFFAPDGSFDFQDKINLTQYETASGLFESAEEMKIFETKLGKIVVPICYDIEFPLLITHAVQLGAEIILNPSFTSTLSGHHRVELCCRVRAIENQCLVISSPAVGKVYLGNVLPEMACGRSGIFGPADNYYPDNGIIALGEMNEEMLLIAEIRIESLALVRKEGQVHNYFDTHNLFNRMQISFPIIKIG